MRDICIKYFKELFQTLLKKKKKKKNTKIKNKNFGTNNSLILVQNYTHQLFTQLSILILINGMFIQQK